VVFNQTFRSLVQRVVSPLQCTSQNSFGSAVLTAFVRLISCGSWIASVTPEESPKLDQDTTGCEQHNPALRCNTVLRRGLPQKNTETETLGAAMFR
jgi:hypothetical protein